jgi:hypothetical protein
MSADGTGELKGSERSEGADRSGVITPTGVSPKATSQAWFIWRRTSVGCHAQLVFEHLTAEERKSLLVVELSEDVKAKVRAGGNGTYAGALDQLKEMYPCPALPE